MDEQEKLREKLKINDIIAAGLGLIGSGVAVAENNFLYQHKPENDPQKLRYQLSGKCKALRAIESVTTVLLLIFIVRHSLLYFNFMKDRRKILRESKFKFKLKIQSAFYNRGISKL